jgi:hypothetical protein
MRLRTSLSTFAPYFFSPNFHRHEGGLEEPKFSKPVILILLFKIPTICENAWFIMLCPLLPTTHVERSRVSILCYFNSARYVTRTAVSMKYAVLWNVTSWSLESHTMKMEATCSSIRPVNINYTTGAASRKTLIHDLAPCQQERWFRLSGLKFPCQICELFGLKHRGTLFLSDRNDNLIVWKQQRIQFPADKFQTSL